MPIDDYGRDRTRCPARFAGARCELRDEHPGRCQIQAIVYFDRGSLSVSGTSSVKIEPLERDE